MLDFFLSLGVGFSLGAGLQFGPNVFRLCVYAVCGAVERGECHSVQKDTIQARCCKFRKQKIRTYLGGLAWTELEGRAGESVDDTILDS